MPHTDYVVNLAIVKCSMGTLPLPFLVTSQVVHLVNNVLAVATELDRAPLVNIPCFGICQQLTKLASGVPTPCVPVPTGWKGANPARKIMGLKPLLEKATCQCGLGGTISFQSSGQKGLAKYQTGPNFTMLQAGQKEPGKKGVWTKELNKTPLEPDHEYLVDNYLYSTDSQGRVVKVCGDLAQKQEERRNEYQQKESVRKKDGQGNVHFKKDKRKPGTKQLKLQNGQLNSKFKPDKRQKQQQREYMDDGGHLLAAMFDGAGEQINYVAMASTLNQAGGGWYDMEQIFKSALDGDNPPPEYPKEVEVEIDIIYGVDKRPVGFQVEYWIDGINRIERFTN
ncbi:DNA/RNA non-specific endonuclease [Hymenobacter sp. H14-R3]|uniref:DNA/RNA non-specific endonuclease n=1 Tax=Hymenobacter sp. H14-R3 TaxID=3046308 RepID=UPI0024B9390E|nr:DNA/RNA non-specific endonuclease [Hymenobacter sp. H14-R3]MDJ0364712.1 DNA/RNA non-specific endonuclease [Hymenobacter sp. H14-R3]